MADPARTVALFVTCLVDLFRPTVGEAAVRLLEQAGFRVVVPAQTCCGQVNFNAGDRAGAARLATHMIAAFADCEFVVAPSGSCAAMIREYPALFAEGTPAHAAALALAARTWELTAFLRDVVRTPLAAVRWPVQACYHDSCSSMRQLGIRQQPRALLAQIEGLALSEIESPEECCGFGGLFCVKYPETSARIGDHKIDAIVATGADYVIGADLGCLLHLEGRMQRRGIAVSAVHVAEALAGLVPEDLLETTSADFPRLAREALGKPTLQRSLEGVRRVMPAVRAAALRAFPEFAQMRERARDIRDLTLGDLQHYLLQFEANVIAAGGEVHWARTGEEACRIVGDLCERAGARTVIKSKSMVTEEIGLNDSLAAAGILVTETDLGEYIIQLRNERPSHILAPALHLSLAEVGATFELSHQRERPVPLTTAEQMLVEAREELRPVFLAADVGITGANFLIAQTGGVVIVTNEGNADLSASLPGTHIVVTGIEKVVATLEDVGVLLKLLARSAIGEPLSSYTTLVHGPRQAGDASGPARFHVVLVDNGRSALLGTPHQDILRCIRCSACLNHCPVYTAIGGHAYGSVYSGPMGAVLTPALAGATAAHLPNASTLCGRCESVCPVAIPIPKMLRHWRERAWASRAAPGVERRGLQLWGWLCERPWAYRLGLALAARALRSISVPGGTRRRIRRLPFGSGWSALRDMPAPDGETFQERWRRRQRARVS